MRLSAPSAADRLVCAAAVALLPAAILPPLVFVALPRLQGLLESDAAAVALFGLLLLLPGLTGLAAARLGLHRIARIDRVRRDGGDQPLAVWRIFGVVLLFGYGFALAVTPPQDSGGRDCLAVASAGLVSGWLLLLLALLRPSPSSLRRHCGIVADAALLSAFLHFGGGVAAAAYPLYLLLILYTGWRFGIGALAAASMLSLLGFGVVIATTDFWRELPVLAAGLIAALAIVPAGAARLLRALADTQQTATAAAALRGRALSAVGGALQQARTAAEPRDETGTGAAAIAALRGRLQDADDLLSVAAGTFAPHLEALDLHALVNEAVAVLRRDTAERGVHLTARIDPALPFQLRGARTQLARLLHNLVGLVLAQAERGSVVLSVDALAATERNVRLRLSVRGSVAPLSIEASGFAIVEQLVALIGGEIETGGDRVSVVVPLPLDPAAEPTILDLADHRALIVSEDGQFAGDLAEPLHDWRADVRWIGGFEVALDYLARDELAGRPILIVDGRTELLPALSFVHRAATAAPAPPFILLVAMPGQAERVAELAEGAVDTFLTAPPSVRLLGNALHALPLDGSAPVAAAAHAADTDPSSRPVVGLVTPITSHPRFAADPIDAVDPMAVESLRGLGGKDGFLDELVETFRDEVRPLMEQIGRTAAAADLAGFYAALDALRRCAGTIGGVRLCEAAKALRGIGGDELRRRGSEHVQRLAAELGRLDGALAELLGAPLARRL